MPSQGIAEWLRQARRIFAAAYEAPRGYLTVTLEDRARRRLSYQFPADVSEGPVPMLSPLEADILRVIGDGAMVGKTIAARLGQRYNATLKTVLANLRERGILQVTSDGYRRTRSDRSDQ